MSIWMVSIIARIIRRVVLKSFAEVCDCRKPHPGMLLSARDYLHIDMAASYMVGDKLEDMQAAAAANGNKKCWCVRVNLLRLKQKTRRIGC